jgi:hypothetical protein
MTGATSGLVHEARKRAQLGLAAHRMMKAQIIGDLCHHGVERGIAGEAEDVVGLVVLRPVHRLDAAVVTVAAPDDPGVRPMSLHALRHVLDDGLYLGAFRGARRAQDRRHRGAARDVINVHRREAALVVMGVPERKLLSAMRRAECIVDVEDLEHARPHGGAELVNEGRTQPRRLSLARCILQPADRRLRRQGRAALWTAPDRDLHQRVMPQPVEVDSILVAARNRTDARHHHLRSPENIRAASIKEQAPEGAIGLRGVGLPGISLGVDPSRAASWAAGAHLDDSPPPANSYVHLLLDRYQVEALRAGRRIESSLIEARSSTFEREASISSDVTQQLMKLAKREIEGTRSALSAISADAELGQFKKALDKYSDEDLGRKCLQLRDLISKTILSLSQDGYRLKSASSESNAAEEIVKQMIEESSGHLHRIFELFSSRFSPQHGERRASIHRRSGKATTSYRSGRSGSTRRPTSRRRIRT